MTQQQKMYGLAGAMFFFAAAWILIRALLDGGSQYVTLGIAWIALSGAFIVLSRRG